MSIQQQRASSGFELSRRSWGHLGSFRAMASPCELLIATQDENITRAMMALATDEARRIEQKFSRFIEGNPLWQINHAAGKASPIDAETASLLQFAHQCHQLSDGRFDISAGPLMKLWRFDGGEIPKAADIEQARALVDFSKVSFNEHQLQFPAGMSLDFGGIAKEYAVDRVAYLLAEQWPAISVLVNFGGDIACPISKGASNEPWQVGIENPQRLDSAAALLEIRQGALATSGDTRRFIEKDGKRFGHIIDPRTGYPVLKAPRSVTVLAPNCVTAGMLATMAMLEGEKAEVFLSEQEVEFKCFR
ncbi:FAD:protein FMN transferase [Shewanella canadensis]|uniref:FAD:protein FMN transferase n=1 Tax=Shewanella canadensis TaxID=271096 RepID=A0A431WXH7_9GAMM|nr:FAD:protein FMN transferase [Shewanella canadensis]RTR40118.1 FAD:protein FMN transferase [Shewanella canadensis]